MLIPLLAGMAATATAQVSGQGPRAAVGRFFDHLKAGEYDRLYDQLPTQIQQKASKEQTVESLKRLGSFLVMDRMQVGRIQQRGDFAVIDTTVYGRLKRPMQIQGEEVVEGRVLVQQYLLKEGREWRVITADDRTRGFFLRSNPDFTRGFQLSSPEFAFKRNGAWQSLGARP
ncbi:MAG: hypothetical protein ABI882_09090 [Acidobacteriota bacterium]